MYIGNKLFDFEQSAYIMGILNVTPDSFSDGGNYATLDKALFHVEEMINDGVDIIDIGGESTRPGHVQISIEEELSRVIPVISAIKKNFDIPLSIDTYRSQTLKSCIEAGIDLINDIWGLRYDEKIGHLAKIHELPICLMHNRKDSNYGDNFWNTFIDDLKLMLSHAQALGISKDKILIDPGLGFQKSFQKDLYLSKKLDSLKLLGFPILYGSSRKRFIKNIVGEELTSRDIGTLATTVLAYQKGARLFRVHNVKLNKLALNMAMAIEGTLDAGNNNSY